MAVLGRSRSGPPLIKSWIRPCLAIVLKTRVSILFYNSTEITVTEQATLILEGFKGFPFI